MSLLDNFGRWNLNLTGSLVHWNSKCNVSPLAFGYIIDNTVNPSSPDDNSGLYLKGIII